MERLKILVVEDEKMIADSLVEILDCLGHSIVGVTDTHAGALDILQKKHVDMVMLDIQLSQGDDGVELAEIINREFELPFIFTTAYADPDTLARAGKECPYGYIVKPYGIKDIHAAIEMALQNFARTRALQVEAGSPDFVDDTIYLKVDSRLVKVNEPEIMWVEAKGDYAVFKTEEKSYIVHSTMKNIEKKLSGQRFMKVHRSFIINLDKVIDIEDSNLMIQQKIIPISRANKAQLMSRINML